MHEASQDKKRVIEESEKFLTEQIENNRQVQETIQKLEKNLGQMKEEQIKIKEMLSTYDNQVRI